MARPVFLWISGIAVSRSEDAWYVDKLLPLCAQASVTLHLLDAHKGERLQSHYLTDKIAIKVTPISVAAHRVLPKRSAKGYMKMGLPAKTSITTAGVKCRTQRKIMS